MNFRFSTSIAALGCVLLASCYPYDESKDKKQAQQPTQKNPTAAEQQKIKEQREKIKEREDLAKQDEVKPTGTETTSTTQSSETFKPPTEEKKTDYPVAMKIPGQEGYVLSPYNNKKISVLDDQNVPIPSGTLVQDPTYPSSEKKYFRVP